MEGEGKKRLAKLGALDLNTTFTNVNNDGTDDDSKQDDEISDGRKSLDKKPDGNKESGSDAPKPRQRTVFSWESIGTPLSLNKGKKLQSSWVLCMPNKL